MNFGAALQALRERRLVRRAGWNGAGMYLGLQVATERDLDSANTLPYVWLRTAQGDRVPWVCSQTDLLAEDWENVSWTEPSR